MTASTAPATPVAPIARPEAKETRTAVTDTKNVAPTSTTMISGCENIWKHGRPMDHTTSPMTAAAIDLEVYLHQTLNLCNKLAKTDLSDPALTASEPQPAVMGLGSEVAAAKMLNYCIRMLHADGWHPPTIIRAMVLRESGLDAGMRTTMYKALRERREEIKVSEMKRSGIVAENLELGGDKSGKKSGGSSRRPTRKVVMPGKGRKARSGIENGARGEEIGADLHDVVPGGRMARSPGHEGHSFGPFMSLI